MKEKSRNIIQCVPVTEIEIYHSIDMFASLKQESHGFSQPVNFYLVCDRSWKVAIQSELQTLTGA